MLFAASLATIPRACVAPHDGYPFCDTALPLSARVDDLVSRLDLHEKAPLLTARMSPLGAVPRLGVPEYDWGANCVHGVQSRCAPDGRCPTSWPNPNTLGASFNASMWTTMGSIIGVELRALWLQGVSENHENDLPHLGLDCWSPNINIVRDPRWGRNLETPSEDPTVCGEFGVAVTRGLQEGADPRFAQAIVTLKHFDANSLEGPWGEGGELTRHTFDATISAYDLASSYLPAFRSAVVRGHALGVMCSYNSINGVPSCANKWLLKDLLRDEWGFEGYVTSDSGAVADVWERHNFTSSGVKAVSAALAAGCDVNSGGNRSRAYHNSPYNRFVAAAVESGELPQTTVDAALRRSLRMRFRLGLFDPIDDQPFWKVPPSAVASEAHTAAAVDASAQGLVLLQNGGGRAGGGAKKAAAAAASAAAAAPAAAPAAAAAAAPEPVLPLRAPLRVAVVGPHADDRDTILGNYLGQMCPDGFRSRACVTSPYEAIAALNRRAGAAPGHTTSAPGVGVNSSNASGVGAAMAAARAADAIVFFGGLDLECEREGHDRHAVGLPGLQPSLLKALLALGKPLALVLLHGGMLTLPPALLAAPNLAVVSAGYPGKHGADALAAALLDTPAQPATDRWGLTPYTWYSEAGWAAAAFDMLSFDMSAPPGRTYRFYRGGGRGGAAGGGAHDGGAHDGGAHDGADAGVQWPFGSGLAYARRALTARAAPGGSAVTAGVTNPETSAAAARPTDAVVLVYLRPCAGTVPETEPASRLVRQLVHFARVGPLAPGAAQSVTFNISGADATLQDAAGQPKLYAGKYDVEVSIGNAPGEEDVALRFECGADGGGWCSGL